MGVDAVKFGTDGWRGVIADDFTFENVRIAASAIGNYLLAHEGADKGAAIGYDTRFGSRAFAEAVGEVLAEAGIPVLLSDRITPTPALSYGVRGKGCAGGVMITSSHNPYQWNGVKYKAWYGGSGRPAIITEIEKELGKPLPKAAQKAKVEAVDFVTPYIAAICDFANLEAIRTSGLILWRFAASTILCFRGLTRNRSSRISARWVLRPSNTSARPDLPPMEMQIASARWMSMGTSWTRTRSSQSCCSGCSRPKTGRAG
jgi:phosphomannomutase